MSFTFNPTEEHYLKREVLRFQLSKELDRLNDKYALRRFGYPFCDGDPLSENEMKSPSRLLHKVIRSPKSHSRNTFSEPDNDENSISVSDLNSTDFPMLSFFLQKFVMTFPLLSKDLVDDKAFWQKKVQVFYEHFMSLPFSDTYDREQATKRKKMGKKLSKIILLLFNSGIGSSLEVKYYNEDKIKIEEGGARVRSKVEEFAIPTKKNLQDLVTNEPVFINDLDLNVISVVDETNFAKTTDSADSFTEEKKNITKVFSSESITPKPKSSWMKSAFDMTTSKTSSLFSKLSMSETKIYNSTKEPDWYYLIKVREKKNIDDSEDFELHYVRKTYSDFKKLAADLKTAFPGKELPKLPHKSKKSMSIAKSTNFSLNEDNELVPQKKTMSSFEFLDDNDSNFSGSSDNNMSQLEPKMDRESINSNHSIKENISATSSSKEYDQLKFEKTRTSLRQYIRKLCKDKETVSNSAFVDFFNTDTIEPLLFNSHILEDIRNRELVDVNNLENQIRFQKLALDKSMILQDSMTEFKENLLKDKSFILEVVHEIKEHSKVEELSPLLQNFIEWCKVYLSATIYQLFLGNDNSYEFYNQIKRLHKLMPYSVMAQIMKFTNPMSIMKNMIELFMAQPFGNHSLLQTMFSSVLADDLKSQAKVIQALEEQILNINPEMQSVISCLNNYIFDHDSEEMLLSKTVNETQENVELPNVMLVLIEASKNGMISQSVFSKVSESYVAWKSRNDVKENSRYADEEELALFSHLKELFQLYIREQDKQLMKQLWEDPELAQLLKHIFIMIYEPMVKIFKVARVDVALKNFEKFMNDLIKLMDGIINGNLTASSEFSIVESIHNLVTAHQDSFFGFVHDVYNNDTEGIFEGFVTWILDIMDFLQNSKFSDDASRIDFAKLVESSNSDANEIKREIDNVINYKLKARMVYQQLLDSKIEKDKKSDKNLSKVMANNWDHINAVVLPEDSLTFGINDNELMDLDIEIKDFDETKDDEEDVLERHYEQLLHEVVDANEIQKFATTVFEKELKAFLNQNCQ